MFAHNVGDVMTFKILNNDLNTVLHRIMVRSAADTNHWNYRASFKSDVQDSIRKLGKKPSVDLRKSNSKDKSKRLKQLVSARTRSKVEFSHLDHGVVVRTISKSQNKFNLHEREDIIQESLVWTLKELDFS